MEESRSLVHFGAFLVGVDKNAMQKLITAALGKNEGGILINIEKQLAELPIIKDDDPKKFIEVSLFIFI